MTFLRKSCSLVLVWIKSLPTVKWSSFCSGSRRCGMWNEFCHDMIHAKILHQSLGYSSFWNPQICFQLLALSVANLCWLQPVCVQHSQVSCLLQAFQNVDDFQPSLKHLPRFCLSFTHWVVPKSLLDHLNGFHRGVFKFNTKFDAHSLFCLLSHFECDNHTVHTLTQYHLRPPLSSTVKFSLFTHALSSPLSLAARLH